jgi:hypothetical protein
MAKPTIVEHSWCGDAVQCENSIVGANGSYSGLSFTAGYFASDSGIEITATDSPSNTWNFGPHNLYPEGCIEMWIKPTGWSMSSGAPDDGQVHRLFLFASGETRYIYVQLESTAFVMDMKDSTDTFYRLTITHDVFSADEWGHIAFTWSAANGRMKFFANGIERGDRAAALSITGSDTFSSSIGTFYGDSNNRGWKGAFDGWIYRNEYVTDFSDRENRRRYLNDYIGL